MNYGFWKQLKRPFFVLAPMADVTDLPFRSVLRSIGKPDVFFTEFVSCAGMCSAGRTRLEPLLAFEEEDRPIVAQFFGTNPEHFYICARYAREAGFDGFDINMGCPDRKVMKQGAGIALCNNPKLAQEIIAAAREGARSTGSGQARDMPVSVKTRLGIGKVDLEGWIQLLLDMKLPVLSVHGRTAKELSDVPAHWDLIGEVARMGHSVGTLVVGNGDVMSMQDGREKAEQSDVDGVMVGRGIFTNPWFFNESVDSKTVSPDERIKLLLLHTKRFTQFRGKNKNFDTLKRFYKIYISGWDGAKELRIKLMQTKSADEVKEVMRSSHSHILKNVRM